MGRRQGYFRVCRWNWRERKLANICKCNSSFSCCQHSKPEQYFWRLATLQRQTDQLLSFLGLQYICCQSLDSLVCCLFLPLMNVLEPNYQNWVKNMNNDLWSCTDWSEQLLDQKGYMFVSNFTDSAYVWDSFKLFIAFSLWEEDNQPPNNTPKNSCLIFVKNAIQVCMCMCHKCPCKFSC